MPAKDPAATMQGMDSLELSIHNPVPTVHSLPSMTMVIRLSHVIVTYNPSMGTLQGSSGS